MIKQETKNITMQRHEAVVGQEQDGLAHVPDATCSTLVAQVACTPTMLAGQMHRQEGTS